MVARCLREVSLDMLSNFIASNRREIIARCRARVLVRSAPRATEDELEHGIPAFLDQLAAILRSKLLSGSDVGHAATAHGGDLLRGGFTIAQVVHDYGDVCQTITEMAIEQHATITTEEFQALNLSLDEAIAGAVTEFGRLREIIVTASVSAKGDARATEDLGLLAHELRNLLGTATLATEVLRSGNVGISGSTGQVLVRTLASMRDLVDRSFVIVRLKTGLASPDPIVIGHLMEEVEVSAMMQANAYGHQLIVETRDARAVVHADRQILASIVTNLLQNAFKYTRPHTHVTLRTLTAGNRVRIEVEDECGGLPTDAVKTLFEPYVQESADRSGLGLGLSICQRGAEAIGGTIQVRDLPGKGCVFTVELPLAAEGNQGSPSS
jgi:signal transduction histidine kinase